MRHAYLQYHPVRFRRIPKNSEELQPSGNHKFEKNIDSPKYWQPNKNFLYFWNTFRQYILKFKWLFFYKWNILLWYFRSPTDLCSLQQVEVLSFAAEKYKIIQKKETKNNILLLNQDLQNESWEHVYNEYDAHKAYNIFLDKLTYYYNTSIPLVRMKSKKCKKQPWITEGILNSIKTRNCL